MEDTRRTCLLAERADDAPHAIIYLVALHFAFVLIFSYVVTLTC